MQEFQASTFSKYKLNSVSLKKPNIQEIKNLMSQNLSYGFWPSSITTDDLTNQSIGYSEVKLWGDHIYWLETRPLEKGRSVLVCFHQNTIKEILPNTLSVRTRAQEYGGSCYCVTANIIYFVNDQDQAIYSFQIDTQLIRRISPKGHYRYADLIFDYKHQQLISIREYYRDHHSEPISDIIAINVSDDSIKILVSGEDFYSNPQVSPCGQYLSYLSWNHPQMPWDGTYCSVASFNAEGDVASSQLVSGSITESIFQPQWSASGKLYFVSDRSDWWNIYCWDGREIQCMQPMKAEFATPQWVFGMSTFGFLNDHEIFCCYSKNGQWKLATINTMNHQMTPVNTDFCDINAIATSNNRAAFIASDASEPSRIMIYQDKQMTAITPAKQSLDNADIAKANPIIFPTENGENAYGFYYPPTNKQFDKTLRSNKDEKPPLIIMCHGGPTGACTTGFNIKIQYWTNRGFAVIDVNYHGSTGYGRQYRDSLKHFWGIKDVADVASAAQFAIDQSWADPQKIIIRGSSAGGFTVLAALTFTSRFSMGCSLYGIGDLEALTKDTHKFEARYLDSLVGTYPEMRSIYHQRSPINHIEKLNCPVIFFRD
jgi:dipeptidyl aminopeptidase/acylaminoacyl peptidase